MDYLFMPGRIRRRIMIFVSLEKRRDAIV